MTTPRFRLRTRVALVAFFLCGMVWSVTLPARADASQYFPQTGHSVSGRFLTYWQQNGGLPVFGYPITDAANAVDPETGKSFLTQWFERRRFEYHPENQAPYDILGGLIGKDLRRDALSVDFYFQRAAPLTDARFPQSQQRYFQETGHNLRFAFLAYCQKNGGLAQFGFPIDEEHREVDPQTGNVFTMQWFERARFEYHPENAAPYTILLGLLGNQIQKPHSGPTFAWQIRTGSTGGFVPYGLVVDHTGAMYVVDSDRNRVQKYDAQGHLLLGWGTTGTGPGQFTVPFGITCDIQGNVYVADSGNGRIQKFDANGHFLAAWNKTGYGSGLFGDGKGGPFDVAVDAHGFIYVLDTANATIVKLDATGQPVAHWGWTVPSGSVSVPAGIAVDGQGYIYITDMNINRVMKFDSTGTVRATWGTMGYAAGQFTVPTDITVDAHGNVYVRDTHNSRVEKFDSQGNFIWTWGSAGNADGQFDNTISGPSWPASGIAVDAQDNIYIADTVNGRVEKIHQP